MADRNYTPDHGVGPRRVDVLSAFASIDNALAQARKFKNSKRRHTHIKKALSGMRKLEAILKQYGC